MGLILVEKARVKSTWNLDSNFNQVWVLFLILLIGDYIYMHGQLGPAARVE